MLNNEEKNLLRNLLNQAVSISPSQMPAYLELIKSIVEKLELKEESK
jgi:hypothetical protein